MKSSVKIFAPATISNVGPGFDLMGFAIEQPGDIMIVKPNDKGKIRIINNSGSDIPTDPEKNVAGVAAMALMESLGCVTGFDLIFETKINPGSGIGSSAASATAAVVGVNEMLSRPYTQKELLPFAMKGEFIASGSVHADNVAPALLGGFILIRSYDPIDIIRIDAPHDLICTVAHPEIEIKTSESRKLIPKDLSVKKTLEQCGNIAGLIAGLTTSDYSLIGRCLQDVIAEPVRSALIPGYADIKARLHETGALGGNISGSGPSVFALSDNPDNARKAASLMEEIFKKAGLPNKVYISKISRQGTRLLD
ncbi:MAG: homoserine kinase [Bacteroidales bacterium]|nr:homoserine kinase [Bacteroidales bacterium]